MDTPDSDLFQLLGLVPGASSSEVRFAFRKLAMQWHPDRNSDPYATDYFKRLRAAHDSLLADIGEHDTPRAGGGRTSTSDKKARRTRPQRPRAGDRHETLTVELEDAFIGCAKEVFITDEVPCPDCDGQGVIVLSRGVFCTACHGSGRLRTATGLETCNACDGRGFCYRAECPCCAGCGGLAEPRPVVLQVPAGSRGGDVLRVPGAGESAAGMDDGDLLVTIRIAPHPLYRIEGQDLVMRRPVGALRMLIGGEIVLPHPRGRLRLTMTAGPAREREWRLEGAGWPGNATHNAGALRVELHPVLPERLDAELHDLLAPLVAAVERRGDVCQSEVAAWEARWLP